MKKFFAILITITLFATATAQTSVNGTTGNGCTAQTVWNGSSWSNGEPTNSITAVISDDYTITTDFSACSLSVINGAQLTVKTGYTLNLQNEITVQSGAALIIESNANLVQVNDSAVNSGNITVKKVSANLYKNDFTLWSSPVTGQNLLAFSPNTTVSRFYEYKYDNGSEQYFSVDAANTNFDAAKGYLIRMPSTSTVPGYDAGTAAMSFEGSFTGTANNGVITKTLSTDGSGYTATGNPYASPISIQDFFDANEGALDGTSALYFWRKKNSSNAGTYATITKDAYVYNHAQGDGDGNFGGEQWDNLFNVATTPENWVINAGQGFFVKAAQNSVTPVLTFNNAMRRGAVHNNQFFKEQDIKSRMWLNLSSTSTFSQAAVVYSNTATTGLDAGRDAAQIVSGTTELYTIAQATNLLVQARPAFNSTDVVTVGFKVTAAGTYTITLHNADGIFADGQVIYLKDKVTNTVNNLSEGNYTFTSDAGTFNGRFEILYANEALGIDPVTAKSSDIIVYANNGTVTINANTANLTNVAIYTIDGKQLYNAAVNGSVASIANLTTQQQVIIVNVTTDKGSVSKKIMY